MRGRACDVRLVLFQRFDGCSRGSSYRFHLPSIFIFSKQVLDQLLRGINGVIVSAF